MSCLFYLIYTLDQPLIPHNHLHENIIEYRQCKAPTASTYVDDIYSIIIKKPEETLWNSASNNITQLNNYYINNRLVNNVDKTMIMLITRNLETKNQTLHIMGQELKHKKNL